MHWIFPEMLLVHSSLGLSNRVPEILTPNACKPQEPRHNFPLFPSSERQNPSLVHGACPSLADIGLVGLGLGDTLGQDLGVLVLSMNVSHCAPGGGQVERGARRVLTASSLTFSDWRLLRARRWRLCWRRWGVTSLWILGALVKGFLPSPLGCTSRRMTYLRT